MIGTKLAHYEITSHLGTGGMGEVYQATDSKLGRSVAIKLLPEAFTQDHERAARFEREARVLASLNHPNIATIHGVEESGGRKFLVMELVGGETLAEKIKRGAIPVHEALDIAIQMTEALEAAHEKGVIHRDLKPANIKVTPDGKVKVLDFGLAKAFAGNSENTELSNSPTKVSMAATNAGVVLGTAAYMSPEQAKGRTVGKRTDIFGFGCVLYEMLTGRAAFEGEDIADILSRVLQREPDWTLLPPAVPPRIRELLQLCLHKDVRKRRSDAADVRIDIERALSAPAATPDEMPARSSTLAWVFFTLALLVAMALSIPAFRYLRSPSPPETRVEIVTPTTGDPVSFALSPDGRQIVFVASGDGVTRLWLRSLDSTTVQPLTGTEGASYPFWSPNSHSIGFFAQGKLKSTDIGGTPRTLAEATLGRGGTWSPDGLILYAPTGGGPLFRVTASGGAVSALTKLEARQTSHRFPFMLPDGRRFLFFASGPDGVRGISIGSLDSPETKFLMATDAPGSFLPPHWLLSVRQAALLAWRFDASRGEITGEPVTVANSVGFDTISTASAFSVSAAGLVAYRSGATGRRQLIWFDRTGKKLGVFGQPDEDGLADPELSPSGSRVAVDRNVENNTDIWILDGSRKNRITFDPSQDSLPVWSPDESRIVFRSNRNGVLDLYLTAASGGGADELLIESKQFKSATSWKDGFILYHNVDPQTAGDLLVLPVDKSKKEYKFLGTAADERAGQFSPNGKWVAYQSGEAGTPQIYVRPFPEPGGQRQVSTTSGGIQVRWAPDGNELYYLAPDGKLMAVRVLDKGTTIELGDPIALFQPRIVTGPTSAYRAQYDVSKDGRFLVNVTAEDAVTAPINLLLNWNPPAK